MADNDQQTRIKIIVGEEEMMATLYDHDAARDFIEMLPMTMELKDYASTEKIYGLSEKLSTKGSPSGSAARAGDIAYYVPWGNLVLFYKDFGYSNGLIILGRIEWNIDVIKISGSVNAQFELMNNRK